MIAAALSLLTGGSFTRLAVTLLAGAVIGGWGAWQVQSWRHAANASAQMQADAAAREEQARRAARATDAAISSTQATGAYHARLQTDLRAQIDALQSARNDDDRAAALERLRLAGCAPPAAASVPRAAARSGADGLPPQWRIDHWLSAP